MDYKKILKDFFNKLNYVIKDGQISRIMEFHRIAAEFNLHTNILGTKDPASIFVRHVLDSLSILELKEYFNPDFAEGKTILDLGSGGGFPGILLAIIFDSNKFFLIDKNKKNQIF